MRGKNGVLVMGILASLLFLGFLGESGPHNIFGLSINIWFVRLAWLAVAVFNISKYMKIRKSEQKSN